MLSWPKEAERAKKPPLIKEPRTELAPGLAQDVDDDDEVELLTGASSLLQSAVPVNLETSGLRLESCLLAGAALEGRLNERRAQSEHP